MYQLRFAATSIIYVVNAACAHRGSNDEHIGPTLRVVTGIADYCGGPATLQSSHVRVRASPMGCGVWGVGRAPWCRDHHHRRVRGSGTIPARVAARRSSRASAARRAVNPHLTPLIAHPTAV